MTRYKLSTLFLTTLISTAICGCSFSKLKDDIARFDMLSHEFSGNVILSGIESNSVVLAAMQDNEGNDTYAFRVMSGPREFVFKAAKEPLYFFAFDDRNKDLAFQSDEPYGRNAPAGPVDPATGRTDDIRIVITPASTENQDFPKGMVGKRLADRLGQQGVNFQVGTVTELDNAWFSEEQAKKGLWEPYGFMEDAGTGIHFLENYDPKRIPVLFVHGINGTPQNFRAIIENLDRSRYQAWVFSYPSGLRLSLLARGLYNFMGMLNRVYDFDRLHLVAHSMGGLVSRGSINLCVKNNDCDYLRSYTTMSTPWAGVASAKSGVKWAPTVVPVWRDLDPNSIYVQTLFDTPLPKELPYYLIFGFKQGSILGSDSSDGVIKLTSQLRLASQEQSSEVRGFNESHTSILSSDIVIENIMDILDSNSP